MLLSVHFHQFVNFPMTKGTYDVVMTKKQQFKSVLIYLEPKSSFQSIYNLQKYFTYPLANEGDSFFN